MLRLSFTPDAKMVRVSSEPSDAIGGELAHLFLAHGGVPRSDGFDIPPLGFRRCSVDFAAIVRSQNTEIAYDPNVERLLRRHLSEIQARRQADRTESVIPQDELLQWLGQSGRFVRRLTDEQLRDLSRLAALPHGANFSVPGAGKTTALLALHEISRVRDDIERLLVVAPKNTFLSWESELAKCFTQDAAPALVRLTGGRAGVAEILRGHSAEIALITYQLLPNVLDLVAAWVEPRGCHVVLDESHRIKGGAAGVIASAALRLTDLAQRRDILSGTPLPHSPEDLRPQLDFLWPGQRILPDGRLRALLPEDTLVEVQRAVAPLYVRTTKQELNLPPLVVSPLRVTLGPLQRELYELLRSEARRLTSGMPTMDRRLFRSLGRHVVRLLQTASNPMLLTRGEILDADEQEPIPVGARAWELLRDFSRYETPAKLTAAVDRTRQLTADTDTKVLIWTSFILNIDALDHLLSDLNPVTLHGSVATGASEDPETREGRILRFHQDPACRLMIANPAAGGEGISLHEACHHAIYLDRTFNAAHYLQSIDRIHRLGLPPDITTHVEIVEARETIDYGVAERLKVKLEAMARILSDPGLMELAYDPDDVFEDFPGGIAPEDVEEIVDHLFEEPSDDH